MHMITFVTLSNLTNLTGLSQSQVMVKQLHSFLKSAPFFHLKSHHFILGLMWEVINGIMKRKDWQACLKLPLGIIPAGSGNALECYLDSLNFFTAAMNIIKGYPRPMDLWRVTQQDFMEWGFVVSAWCMVRYISHLSEFKDCLISEFKLLE